MINSFLNIANEASQNSSSNKNPKSVLILTNLHSIV
jgi:hypothetical protein